MKDYISTLRIFVLVAAFFPNLDALSQRREVYFYANDGSPTDSATSRYFEFWQTDGNRPMFHSVYTASRRVRAEDTEITGELSNRTFYYENGIVKLQGQFKHVLPQGTVKSFYPDGKPQGEYLFSKVEFNTDMVVEIINYWDPSGNQIITSGSGYCTCDLTPFKEDPFIESGSVVNRHKEGAWTGVRQTTNDSFVENYSKGVLIEGALKSDGVETSYKKVEESAVPADGMRGFYMNISKKITYPRQARRLGIQGTVFVSFVIQLDGSLTDVRVVKGIGGGCDEEAVRVISEHPKWLPGMNRGRPAKQRYTLPVIFKLG